MAVTAVNKISSQLTEEPTGHRQYDVLYEVITNDVADGPAIVRQASDLPKIGDTYSYGNDSDQYAACVTRGPFSLKSVDTSRKVWSVPVVYSSRPAEGSNQSNNGKDNPIDWEWEVSGSFAQNTKAALKDRNGNRIVNAADEPFIPAPEMDDPRIVLVLKKNTANINLLTWGLFRGACNSIAVWGLASRQAKVMQWSWQVRRIGAFEYIENQWEIHIIYDVNGTTWDYAPLNQGFREKLGVNPDGTPNYVQIRDAHGNLIRQPHLLDATGAKLMAGADPVFYDGANGLDPYELDTEVDYSLVFPASLPGPIIFA